MYHRHIHISISVCLHHEFTYLKKSTEIYKTSKIATSVLCTLMTIRGYQIESATTTTCVMYIPPSIYNKRFSCGLVVVRY